VKSGDRITWTQYRADGTHWDRVGTVWDLAKLDTGLINAWWVIPDNPEPSEILASGALCVGKASARCRLHTDCVPRGIMYASDPSDCHLSAGARTKAAVTLTAAA
jgi:NDP-sugar pyrophosphorylase family protein